MKLIELQQSDMTHFIRITNKINNSIMFYPKRASVEKLMHLYFDELLDYLMRISIEVRFMLTLDRMSHSWVSLLWLIKSCWWKNRYFMMTAQNLFVPNVHKWVRPDSAHNIITRCYDYLLDQLSRQLSPTRELNVHY